MIGNLLSFITDFILNFLSEINSKNDKSEIENYLYNNKKKEYQKFIEKVANEIKDGKSLDEVIGIISSVKESDNLKEFIINDIKVATQPYSETEFLRKLDLEKQKKYIDVVFNNTILQVAHPKKILGILNIDNDLLMRIIGVLNAAKRMIIIGRYDREFFFTQFYNNFRFDDSLTKFIWDNFNNNRATITQYVLLDYFNSIQEIKKTTSSVLKIFEKIVDEE